MSAAIENPASCEIRSVIRFLVAKNTRPIDIHRQLCEVYGNDVMTESGVRRWCLMFKGGRKNVHDEERSGRPSIVTEALVAQIDEKICENCMKLLHKIFDITNFVHGGFQSSCLKTKKHNE